MVSTVTTPPQTQPAPGPGPDLSADMSMPTRDLGRSRVGVAPSPTGLLQVREISSWADVSGVLKQLNSRRGPQIRLDFPEPAADASNRDAVLATQAAIKDFFKSMNQGGFAEAYGALSPEEKKALGNVKAFNKLKLKVSEVYRVDSARVGDTPKLVGLVAQEHKRDSKLSTILTVNPDCAVAFAQALEASLESRPKDSLPDLKMIKVWVGDDTPRFESLRDESLPSVEELSVEDFIKRYAKKVESESVEAAKKSAETKPQEKSVQPSIKGQPSIWDEPFPTLKFFVSP